MKKALLTIVSLLVVFSMMFSCLAVGFADVDAATDEGAAIIKLADAGILNGYLDGLFHAERSLTRAQFCKIANKVFGYTEAGTETFNDVPSTYWGASEISIAQNAGYIKGVGNGNFGPDRPLTREQVCIMLVRILGYEPLEFTGTIADPVSDWAAQDVKTALAYYIFSLESGNTFRAQQAITRGEVSVVLARYLTDATTPIVKPDSEYVLALKDLSAAFSMITFTDTEAKIITPLKTCIDKAIAAADNGTDVTKEYIEANYKSDLKTIREGFNALSKTDSSNLKLKIAKEVSIKTATILYDSFLVATAVENSSGGGGGGGGGGGNSGSGNEGTGNEGTGNEGTGNEGTGNEGTGNEGTGNEGTGNEGTGNEGTGNEGTGNEGSGNDDPDPIIPDESEVVQAIRQIAAEIQALYDDYGIYSYEKPVVDPLLNCLYAVLDDAANGITITKAYVKSEYADAIAEVNRAYAALSDTEERGLKGKLGNLDPDASNILYDYFISD